MEETLTITTKQAIFNELAKGNRAATEIAKKLNITKNTVYYYKLKYAKEYEIGIEYAMSIDEISKSLNISQQQAKESLNSALNKMRNIFKERQLQETMKDYLYQELQHHIEPILPYKDT